MLFNLLKAIEPSFRLKAETLVCHDHSDALSDMYQPIPIHELKLTASMRFKINRARKNPVVVEQPRFDKKLMVIVPYRHREQHLAKFPAALKKFLDKENIQHDILIVEQADDKPFNKGKLLNAGAKWAWDKADYFCFHDIDMIPDISSYAYVNHPTLLSNSATQFDAHVQHSTYFGGVILFDKNDYLKINGFSNQYWHWGCEDDDLFWRCLNGGLTPIAYNNGRYTSLPHQKTITQTTDGTYQKDPALLGRLKGLYEKNVKRYKKTRRGLIDTEQDGLNSVSYELLEVVEEPLYTKIRVVL